MQNGNDKPDLWRGAPARGETVRGKSGVGFGIAAILFVLPWATAAGASAPAASQGAPPTAPARERRGALAVFEGRLIDLSQSWGEARACLIWRQGGVEECFRTPEEMDARAFQLSPERAGRPDSTSGTATASYSASSYSCSSSLRLYDYNYYGGRQLSFWDRGYWQNLWDYGFDDRTSSYAVGGCYVHLAEDPDGWGWWYPGPTYPWAGEPVMSWDWQNTISSIYIE